jgi:hypothetical protein
MNIRFLIIISLTAIFALNFSSCKNPTEYRVDSAFAPYLNRFDSLADLHGKHFNPKSSGLIIEFATLKDNNAGLTHFETPIRIEIDKIYWNDINKFAGADLMKEDLLFHEFGHGLLNRDHLNTTLENGDWKSMMCGGTPVDNRPWNINYRGIRRQYYIEELFNESTPAPDFSSNQFVADSTNYLPVLTLGFTNADNAGWTLTDDSQHKMSLDNNRLKFESKISKTFLVFANTKINIQSDFTFDLTIEYPSGDSSYQYGIIFGYVPTGSDGINDPIEYFTINNNQKMYMGNRTWYSFFTQLNENSIIVGGKNHLKVLKIGQMLYYFINNVYCYCSEITTTQSGTQFGFMVPANGTVWIDNFSISQKKATGVKVQSVSISNLTFETKTMSLPLHSISYQQ